MQMLAIYVNVENGLNENLGKETHVTQQAQVTRGEKGDTQKNITCRKEEFTIFG